MPADRPSSRGTRPGRASRPGTRPGSRPAGRQRSGSGGGSGRSPATATAGQRPRFTGRAAVLVLVVAVLMVSYASSLRAYFEQREHLSTLRASIAASEANISALEREKSRWDDPAFVRAQARERFGWVLPGEIGFQVLDEDGKPLGHSDTLSQGGTEVPELRPQWWQQAWSSVEVAGDPEKYEVPPPASRIRAPKPPKDAQE
jgi:cell division protein FtsB